MEFIAYGKIADMVAEYGAHDMGKEWFAQYGYRYASLIIGDAQYDTSYYRTLAEAKEDVAYTCRACGIKATRV